MPVSDPFFAEKWICEPHENGWCIPLRMPIAPQPKMPTDTKPYAVSVFPAVMTAKQSREEVMTSFYSNGKQKHISIRFTPKQTRLYCDGGYKIRKITLYRVVLPNGKEHLVASQCSPTEVKAFMEGKPIQEFGSYDGRMSHLYFFLPGTWDEEFYTTEVKQVYSYENCLNEHHTRLREKAHPTEDHFGEYTGGKWRTLVSRRDYVVAQEWYRWGRAVVPCRQILMEKEGWLYDDHVSYRTLNPKCSLPLTEFRASRKYNPYDEPEHEVPRKFRADRIALNEDICAGAMRPDRVARMMEKYGDDWMDRS